MSCLFSSVSKENFSAGDMSCNSLSIVSPPSLFAVSCKAIIELMFVYSKGQICTIKDNKFLQRGKEERPGYGTKDDI